MIVLPRRSISRLTLACGAVFAVYVAFVITAVYFASYTTEVSASLREREADVVALETRYYAAVSDLSASDPAAFGFVTPSRVAYVTAAGAPTVTRADR